MKFLIFFQITFLSIFLINDSNAQILNQKTVTQKVYGNCGMCKKTIEKAANVKGISKAEWDADLAMAKITIDSTKTSVDDVLKRIAAVGY
ncbi:MAG: heavy-metal-associated domain-containing protein, partial [Saprospiraceae bacterium]